MMTTVLRPSILRKDVRLVHCLQRERGATCAQAVAPNLFEEILSQARKRTDAAVQLWLQTNTCSDLDLSETLSKIRACKCAADGGSDKDEVDKDMYHRVLMMFNALIGGLIHSSLLHYEGKDQSQSERDSKSERTRAASQSSLVFTSDSMNTSSKGILRRSKSSGNFEQEVEAPMEEQNISERNGVTFSEESRTRSLLNMLECFVRLKESTGVERAICSLTAMGQVDRRHFNDLVLQVENQFKLISELQSIQDLDLSLTTLIREVVDLPAPMKRIQAVILNKFDLEGFQLGMTVQSFWDQITMYMDKLHSLELLIVEELEYSLQEDNGVFSTTSSKKCENLGSLLKDGLFGTEDVQEMPAEKIKVKLLDFLSDLDQTSLDSDVKDNELQPTTAAQNPSSSVPPPPLVTLNDKSGDLKPEPSEWDIDIYEIHFKKCIGRGTAGTTYLASWSGRDVAVKVATITDLGLDGWKTEISYLRKLHHPNIIRLLGSVYNENPLTYCLVLEYCNGGDLSKALKKPTHARFFFQVASDVAHGLCYLHSRGTIHRDIKPANVLLDGNVLSGSFSAKVTDFGLATFENKSNMTSETGTYRWMAPEVIRHHPYSEKADCYSYGVLIWQLLTRENPFALHSQLEAAGKVALEEARPQFPIDTPSCIEELIENCWAEDPRERFSFQAISENLDKGFDLSTEEDKWMQAPFGHPVYEEVESTEKLNSQRLDSCSEFEKMSLSSSQSHNKPKRLKKLFSIKFTK